MKSTTFFIAVLCSYWNFRICAAVSDWEIRRHDTHVDWRNVKFGCSSDADCTTPNSTCNVKRCECQPNYVFNAPMTACLKVATAYGDVCEETTQCTARLSAGGNCDNGTCKCVKGYHYLHGRCFKSSGLTEKCQSDDECYVNADFEALSCIGNICQCSDGFYKREYRTCRRKAEKIGAECMIDLDCIFDGNAQCNKQEGCFVQPKNTTNSLLRRIMYETLGTPEVELVHSDVVVGRNCTIDKDCELLGAATCDATSKCICKYGYFANTELTFCVPELGEKCKYNDNSSIKNSICRDGRWSCKGATVPLRNNQQCRKVTTAYNQSCQFDEQCYVFGPDALCMDNHCLCNERSHYSKKNMFCWLNRGIGEACKIDEDCYVHNFGSKLTCKESVCVCPTGTHVNAAKTACINDTAILGDPCTANEDCGILQNAICSNNSCTCTDNYFDLSGKCVSGIGGKCTLDADCKSQNSTCVSEQCSCKSGSVSPSADLCVLVSPFGDECQYDVQCSATAAGAFCAFPKVPEVNERMIGRLITTNGVCNCNIGHHYNYKRCYRTKVLHEPCNSRGECYVESSSDSAICLKGVCMCHWNAIEINGTFCKTNASPDTVLSNLIIFTILIIRFIEFV